jgi:hypothetical protein
MALPRCNTSFAFRRRISLSNATWLLTRGWLDHAILPRVKPARFLWRASTKDTLAQKLVAHSEAAFSLHDGDLPSDQPRRNTIQT